MSTYLKEYPHQFVGRLDRWCEICNRPDRDPIHKYIYEQEDREADLEKVQRLIHRERDKDFQAILDDQSSGYMEWAKEECKQGRHEFSGGQCVHCGKEDWHIFREDVMEREIEEIWAKSPTRYSVAWAKLFLENWNRAVKLCNSWDLFMPEYSQWRGRALKLESQQEYARICQSWLAPNGCVDPHIEANNISSECSCPHCLLERELR